MTDEHPPLEADTSGCECSCDCCCEQYRETLETVIDGLATVGHDLRFGETESAGTELARVAEEAAEVLDDSDDD